MSAICGMIEGGITRWEENKVNHYDVIVIGAGPGGIFAAYELMQLKKMTLMKFKLNMLKI